MSDGDWKNSITIQHTYTIGWWLKFFNHKQALRWWFLFEWYYMHALLLVLIPHKDGRPRKIWSPSNHHNFLDDNQSFLITRKGGHSTCFSENLLTTFNKSFLKKWQHPFYGNWNNLVAIRKIVTIGLWTNIFSWHTLSHFDQPFVAIKFFSITTRMGDWKKLVGPFCGNCRIFGH